MKKAPGFHWENLDISLDGEFLTLSGNRETPGRFARTVRLPGGVDPARVDARYQDGVLTVALAKSTPATTTRISIN